MKVLYTSACMDSSGYAEAARNYICALNAQPEVDLYLRTVSFERWKTDIGAAYSAVIDPLMAKKIDGMPDVQIIHLTPENFARQKIPGVYNIGYTVWETETLPDGWVEMINALDEVWVPCDWNVEVFKNSGVNIPITKVPHCFNKESFKEVDMSHRFNLPDDLFKFYSVFQWSARKNPEALLKAYFHEFSREDKVCLILKTFAYAHTAEDANSLKNRITNVKKLLWVDETPPIVLLNESLSREEMIGLHTYGDAFVLPHRAEGWGIPHFEAMALGNTTISTRYSGNLEFMNDNNSVLVDSRLTPCSGMDRPTYNGRMSWGDPDIIQLGKRMREVYEGARPAEDPSLVVDRFGWEKVGAMMAHKLKKVVENGS